MSAREYFVIDSDNHVSYDVKDQTAEAFGSLAKAKRRASELAQSEPSHTVTIARAEMYVTCTKWLDFKVRKLGRKRRKKPAAKAVSKRAPKSDGHAEAAIPEKQYAE